MTLSACHQGHLTHLRRGSNNYGWDPDADRWDKCVQAPPRRPARQPVTIDFLTVKEAAEALRVSKMTVYRLTDSGELGSIRVGRQIRIHRDSFAAYLKRAEAGAV